MKKRLISLILAAIVLLSCAFAEESQNEEYLLPYIDLYAVPLGENAIFEMSNDWAYQVRDEDGLPPMTNIMTDKNQFAMAMKLPADWEATDASDALGIQSFIVEGTALMLGLTTPQSTRLQEMTINDMPAVLVEMNGQGFDILWIGDSGDLYFFLFPNDDDVLVQQMIAVAQSLCVFHRKGEQVNPASDFAYTADGGEVTITDYIGTSEHVLIPDAIDGLPVTALGHRAFYEKTVTTVVVPDSVTEIGAACFSGDNYLVSLKLPDGLKRLPPASLESCMRLYDFDLPQSLEKIYSSVFEFNYYLTHLTLPSSLTEIEQLNFIGLYGLQSLTLAEDNAAFKLDETNGLLMTADGTRLLHCFSDISPAEDGNRHSGKRDGHRRDGRAGRAHRHHFLQAQRHCDAGGLPGMEMGGRNGRDGKISRRKLTKHLVDRNRRSVTIHEGSDCQRGFFLPEVPAGGHGQRANDRQGAGGAHRD